MYKRQGNIQRKGWELAITGTPVRNKNFTWSSAFTFAKTESLVKELAEGLNTYLYGTQRNDFRIENQVGQPWGQAIGRLPKLDAQGKKVAVLNLATIKPLDEHAVTKLAHDSGAIVTVEEHQIAGGMGSAVAELLSQKKPVPQEFVGVKDLFGQSGTQEELIEHYNLGKDAIIYAAKKVITRT